MRFTTILLLLFTASSLSACGGGTDDVEVVLPFVGNIMGKAKNKEENMANRGGLVLPPGVVGLPSPQEKGQANAGESWPADPEMTAKSKAEIAALKQKKYERDGDWTGERSSGNGIEDFKDKVDWSRRQTGVIQDMLKQE